MRRFGHFSDEELYMLSRATIESSYCITMGDNYSEEQQEVHNNLLNELILERKERDYNNAKVTEWISKI